LKAGVETTLGGEIRTAVIFDRDYRSAHETTFIANDCETFCDVVIIHGRKEVENFLLVPDAIDRAAQRRIANRMKRGGRVGKHSVVAGAFLEEFAAEKKSNIMSRYITDRRQFERKRGSALSDASISEAAIEEFDAAWGRPSARLQIIPGKEALSALNALLLETCQVSVTPTAIIDAMTIDEIPQEMKDLVGALADFAKPKAN
jgi:hypothetical protein